MILASGSPRRRLLLRQLGLAFKVQAAQIDERPHAGEPPRRYVQRMAREKADQVGRSQTDRIVLAADTAVIIDGRILGKPESGAMALQMLKLLSGRWHTVITAVALAGASRAQALVETRVEVRPLSLKERVWYVGTGEPMDKAGAYAIQGVGGAFIKGIRGSFSNVVGLPLAETLVLLEESGVLLPWKRR